MAEDWSSIAAEVADAIASVGFIATLEGPPIETGTEYDPVIVWADQYDVTVIDDQVRQRDEGGALVDRTSRVLTIGAAVAPEKGWRALVREQWLRVVEVRRIAPGGVDLMFELTVEAW
jgi:hypothetical protein